MTWNRPNPGLGASGFGERGEPDFALGSVTGVRVFDFGGHWAGTPATGRDFGELAGQHGASWHDGENLAECIRDGKPTGHVPPADGCGCGFWNYWEMDAARLVFEPARPVLAVIEGYGRTVIGERGFRCAKARIVALHLAFDFAEPRTAGETAWQGMFAPEGVAQDNDALKSEGEQFLAERYPSVRIYATQAAMLAMHPPTRDYLPRPALTEHGERVSALQSPGAMAVPFNAAPGSIGTGWQSVTIPAGGMSARTAALLKNWPGTVRRMR